MCSKLDVKKISLLFSALMISTCQGIVFAKSNYLSQGQNENSFAQSAQNYPYSQSNQAPIMQYPSSAPVTRSAQPTGISYPESSQSSQINPSQINSSQVSPPQANSPSQYPVENQAPLQSMPEQQAQINNQPAPMTQPYYANPAIANFLITTTSNLERYRILSYKGLVRGISVRQPSINQNIMAGFQGMFSVNLNAYAEMADQAREEALIRLIEHAKLLGANAVIGLRYESAAISANNRAIEWEVLCYGTAVVVRPSRR